MEYLTNLADILNIATIFSVIVGGLIAYVVLDLVCEYLGKQFNRTIPVIKGKGAKRD